jgi:hypothetical protein
MGFHCPHTPSVPSDRYNSSCPGVASPRLPNYNWTNDGFHNLVRLQPPLTDNDGLLIDDLARRRCQALLSVDDANAALVQVGCACRYCRGWTAGWLGGWVVGWLMGWCGTGGRALAERASAS